MKRLIIVGMIGFCTSTAIYAQNDIQPFGYYIDALRFSQTNPGGSARIQSIGGAQAALGGDLSLALGNPAGLGFFNRSEFTFTPSLNFKTSGSTYLGETSNDTRSKFNINQLGIAFDLKPKEEGIYKGGAFAISLTRVNDFYNNYTIEGLNGETSIIDSFLEQANGATTSQFGGNDLVSLSYFNYLIGPESILVPPGADDVYFTDVTGIPFQRERISNEGAQYQWSFSYGGNIDDRLYFGVGIGVMDLDYRSRRTYSESFDEDPLNSLQINEELQIQGTGINGTAGLIVKPTPFLNIGASFTSPTYYGIDDSYSANMTADWNNFLYEDAIDGDTLLNNILSETDLIISDYSLTTPWRFNGGVAFFLGKNGFISADVKYIDYSLTRLNSSQFSMRDDNKAIEQFASSSLNIRTGAEYRLDNVRFRAGYANYTSPQDALDPLEGSGDVFSGGIGVRLSQYYFDLGVVHNSFKQNYSPYLVENATTPVGNIKSNNTKLLVTMGFNF